MTPPSMYAFFLSRKNASNEVRVLSRRDSLSIDLKDQLHCAYCETSIYEALCRLFFQASASGVDFAEHAERGITSTRSQPPHAVFSQRWHPIASFSITIILHHQHLITMPVVHVVSFKYKDSVSSQERKELYDQFNSFPTQCLYEDGKPYLLDFKSSTTNTSVEKAGKDSMTCSFRHSHRKTTSSTTLRKIPCTEPLL